MNNEQLKVFRKLALDTYEGGSKVQFDGVSGEQAIRNAILEAVGGKWTYNNYQRNKYDVFEILTDVLAFPVGETVVDTFNGMVDAEHIDMGQAKVMDVDDPSLFRVATVASGNSDVRRQRVTSNQIKIDTEMLFIKVYDDLDRFLAGRVDFARLVNKIKASFAHAVNEKIVESLLKAYPSLNSKYAQTGNWNEQILDDIIARVESKLGMKCGIYSTKRGLSKISTGVSKSVVGASNGMKDEYNQLGYFGQYKGSPMIEIPTLLKSGTDDFVEDEGAVFILPIGLKLIKVIFEGEAMIKDSLETDRNDNQVEFKFGQKVGVACIATNYFGIYKIQ